MKVILIFFLVFQLSLLTFLSVLTFGNDDLTLLSSKFLCPLFARKLAKVFLFFHAMQLSFFRFVNYQNANVIKYSKSHSYLLQLHTSTTDCSNNSQHK